jgi:hypothetical protein
MVPGSGSAGRGPPVDRGPAFRGTGRIRMSGGASPSARSSPPATPRSAREGSPLATSAPSGAVSTVRTPPSTWSGGRHTPSSLSLSCASDSSERPPTASRCSRRFARTRRSTCSAQAPRELRPMPNSTRGWGPNRLGRCSTSATAKRWCVATTSSTRARTSARLHSTSPTATTRLGVVPAVSSRAFVRRAPQRSARVRSRRAA